MIAGIVHHDGKILWFDDMPVRRAEDVPRRSGMNGTVWYTTSAVKMHDLIKVMGPDDSAFGPSPDAPLGVNFSWFGANGKEQKLKVMSSSVWGVSSKDPIDTKNQLEVKLMECAGSGVRPSISAAGTALGQYMRLYDGQEGRPKTSQLPPRWRSLSHAAFHGGPICITRAHGKDVVHIDMKGAYLSAMRNPMPLYGRGERQKVTGGWYTFKNAKWGDIKDHLGFVEATLRVDPLQFGEGDVPPLPIKHYGGSLHATGIIRGAWPIFLVRDAVEAGEVEVLEIHQFMFSPETDTIFNEIADDFKVNPQGKILYTRFWGKWAANGGFTGTLGDNPADGAVRSYGLWWESSAIDVVSTEAPPTYRPDLAAMIAGYNHRQVLNVVRKLKKGSILCIYVDAIWTTDIDGAKKIVEESRVDNEWIEKQRGELRLYGPGVYRHNKRMGAAGYSSDLHGELTPERLEAWATSPLHKGARMTMSSRIWTGSPSLDISATSRPVHMKASEARRAHDGPDVHHECWTSRGWLKDEAAERIGRKA